MDKNKSKTGLVMKYFVLKPKGHNAYAKASRKAMLAYADEIGFRKNPQLAKELRLWVHKESGE